MRPDLRADAVDWLELAADDLAAGRLDLTPARPLTRDACFHAQQAAEKCLKALLIFHSAQFDRTHDLNLLGLQLVDYEPLIEPLVRSVLGLSPFATVLRYPGIPVAPDVDEALAALEAAQALCDAAASILAS